MAANISITDSGTQAVASELARLLADEYVLYTKKRNAHWNIECANFYDKHKFFETKTGCNNWQFKSFFSPCPSVLESLFSQPVNHFCFQCVLQVPEKME